MNIGQEITNHLEWMETIASLLGNKEFSEEELRSITQHDQCDLGRWLLSDASSEFKERPGFERLIERHDAFHELAGKLITAVRSGNDTEAIDIETRFIETSQEVIDALHALQDDAK